MKKEIVLLALGVAGAAIITWLASSCSGTIHVVGAILPDARLTIINNTTFELEVVKSGKFSRIPPEGKLALSGGAFIDAPRRIDIAIRAAGYPEIRGVVRTWYIRDVASDEIWMVEENYNNLRVR